MNSQHVNQTALMLACVFALGTSSAAPRHDFRHYQNASAPERLELASPDAAPSTTAGAANATASKGERDPLPRRVERVNSTQLIRAGTEWNSDIRLGENCAFDLKIEFNRTFTSWTFADHESILVQIADRYTNLSTGFKFVDRADYVIQHDFATNTAFHAGVFYLTHLPKRGIVVRDTGTFTQQWVGPFPWPVENLTGPYHDVNGVPFGTLSYCDWADGRFP
jgi:hypothetical protein